MVRGVDADRLISETNIPLRLMGWLALIIAELAWIGWFLVEPLPNANDPSQPSSQLKNTRGLLLMRLVPEIVPGVKFRDSLLGAAWEKLSHFENLPPRLPLLAAAFWIALASMALGDSLSRLTRLSDKVRPLERAPLAFGVGMPCLGVTTLIMGKLGLLTPVTAKGLLVALTCVGVALTIRSSTRIWSKHGRNPQNPSRSSRFGWPLLLLAPAVAFVVLMTLAAMTPPFDFDSLEYHLQGPKEYYQTGRIAFLPHNVYTSMPFQVEMGSYLGMLVMDDWRAGAIVGQVLVALHAPFAAWLIGLTAARWASPWAGLFAAMAYLTTPWIYRLGTITYVEGPLCFFHAALVWLAACSWEEEPSRWRARIWLPIGVLAGGAMACKYPALISAVLPFGLWSVVEAIRRRNWRGPLWFAGGFALVMAPWLLKNIIETGNPVYPLAWNLFGGADWNEALNAKWSRAHGPQPIVFDRFIGSLIDVAGRSDWQSPLYLAFGPLALAVGSRSARRRAWVLAGLMAWIFLTWWFLTHRLDRFWLPLLPAAAALAGMGADVLRRSGWLGTLVVIFVATIGVASNFAHSITPLTSWNDWTANLDQQYIDVPRTLNPTLDQVDAELPSDAKILLVGQASVFHMRHSIVYNTVFDFETIETICKDQDPETIRRSLRSLGITHVYVDWKEIARYRQPGNYGFTDFVTPELFQRLRAQKVLSEPRVLDENNRQLFTVLPSDRL